ADSGISTIRLRYNREKPSVRWKPGSTPREPDARPRAGAAAPPDSAAEIAPLIAMVPRCGTPRSSRAVDLVELAAVVEVHLLRFAQAAEEFLHREELQWLEQVGVLLQHGFRARTQRMPGGDLL